MTQRQLMKIIGSGEDSRTQFKVDVTNPDSLAAEIVAFSNAFGGRLYIGVTDGGEAVGIPRQDVGRINQLISNAASQHIRSPVTEETLNVSLGNGNIVIVITVPEGLDKPYFDRNGTIWLKSGADKRRINSKEELQRLFQSADILYADAVPTRADLSHLDTGYFSRFLTEKYAQELPNSMAELQKLLNNMNLASCQFLNLAGLLLFAREPQFTKPAFVFKAILFPGADVSVDTYLDTEDFEGKVEDQFKGAMAFVMRSLQKKQAGRGVNDPGLPEIPRIVFEEMIVNALVHRDYFISAPIRLFIFADRIELVSPGHLPNHLTVQQIEAGNSNIRNPILASFAYKGILPYRGLGTGIRRALTDWPHIRFIDDREGNQFKVIILRSNDLKTGRLTLNEGTSGADDLKSRVCCLLRNDPEISYPELAERLKVSGSTVKRLIQELKHESRIRRIGAARGGFWEVH